MRVCVTGGGGYVGSMLVPKLLHAGHKVTVLDTFWYAPPNIAFSSTFTSPGLTVRIGDIRHPRDIAQSFRGQDAVIHLACVSNDPSFEMNPDLGKSINYDPFKDMLSIAEKAGVKRFIYASSSSVYGVKDMPNVTEETECEPLTDYSKFKLMCEEDLRRSTGNMEWTIVRPATVCGWAPRLRLDLAVNILTIHALVNRKIIVHGGRQLRPNINIKDMASAYLAVLHGTSSQVDKKTFNVGYENLSLNSIAALVKKAMMDESIEIETQESNDPRSYHVNSDKIQKELGFVAKESIYRAIDSLILNYTVGKIRNPMNNSSYFNIRKMKELNII